MKVRMTIEQAMSAAIRLHEAGSLADAESLCRQVVLHQPAHADALNLLGVIAGQRGNAQEAVDLIRRAIAINPRDSYYHCNLGNALKLAGLSEESIAAYRAAVQADPTDAEAHRQLGLALQSTGSPLEAMDALHAALRLSPSAAEIHNDLGMLLTAIGRLDEAAGAFRRALAIKDSFPEAHNNLGKVLKDQGRLAEAIAAFHKAISLAPKYAAAHNNLGNALCDQWKHDESVASLTKATQLDPNYANAHNNLAVVLAMQGRLDESLAHFDRSIELNPSYTAAHSNRIFTLHYHPSYDQADILREQRVWDQRHAEPLKGKILPHSNDRSRDRRLKIGYVSPDFKKHPIGQLVLPLLEHHGDGFEVFCYSDVKSPDEMTRRFREIAGAWRDTAGLSDEALGRGIREDRIDILIDLTMHTANHRLLVFARKPAPVQVTYLGTASGTGLSTMDYRLTDRHRDPEGVHDDLYVEQSIRLPETLFCYQPGIETDVIPLPALKMGHVTFGNLNKFAKVTAQALEAWSRLMRAVSESRLILHADEGTPRRRVCELMQREGIDPGRIAFAGRQPLEEYFRLHNQIDIGLDTFPYNGSVTTCDALWMGVPVVTMVGRTGASRQGVSLLANVGLEHLVAKDWDEYVEIASKLAGDVESLKELRSSLRNRMIESPLRNPERLARNIESAYRDMWVRWCTT
jgi:predicted O-linked N-acetylglucosamine transferase (SPINDLY family)